MKLDHLTFVQLHRLASPANLLRVTTAYYRALRKSHEEPFMVSQAEAWCPEVKARYQSVLDFLRGPELKSALRKAAAAQKIPPSCSVIRHRVLSGHRFPNEGIRHALAALIQIHCVSNGVPACVMSANDDTLVFAATDELGSACLTYKPGLPWEQICFECDNMLIDPMAVFSWLPWTDDKMGWRINPCNWPVMTPDYQEAVKQLIEK